MRVENGGAVAKICQNYGQRVQNSVFECKVDEGQFRLLKHRLEKTIDHKKIVSGFID